MTLQPDPYRVLGLPPGASLNEIRSAYRRLAKLYHPDAAGERALPRFLAIQAAYERLVDGEGHLRAAGRGGAAGARGGAATGGEPWRADTARSRASRDAWRARRSAASGGGASPEGEAGTRARPRGRPSAAGDTSGGTAAGARPGGERPPAGGGSGDGSSGRQRRPTRKARPGSTTYDEAAGTPRDPSWQGGAWYGPSSGTYWTINPREYADPRKHGPEYQARARRAKGVPGTPSSGPVDPAATAAEPGDQGSTDAEPAATTGAPAAASNDPAPPVEHTSDRASAGRLRSLARRIARTPRT
jgi:curved DNA-binding protein CbpA